jgi:hypothetical protein
VEKPLGVTIEECVTLRDAVHATQTGVPGRQQPALRSRHIAFAAQFVREELGTPAVLQGVVLGFRLSLHDDGQSATHPDPECRRAAAGGESQGGQAPLLHPHSREPPGRHRAPSRGPHHGGPRPRPSNGSARIAGGWMSSSSTAASAISISPFPVRGDFEEGFQIHGEFGSVLGKVFLPVVSQDLGGGMLQHQATASTGAPWARTPSRTSFRWNPSPIASCTGKPQHGANPPTTASPPCARSSPSRAPPKTRFLGPKLERRSPARSEAESRTPPQRVSPCHRPPVSSASSPKPFNATRPRRDPGCRGSNSGLQVRAVQLRVLRSCRPSPGRSLDAVRCASAFRLSCSSKSDASPSPRVSATFNLIHPDPVHRRREGLSAPARPGARRPCPGLSPADPVHRHTRRLSDMWRAHSDNSLARGMDADLCRFQWSTRCTSTADTGIALGIEPELSNVVSSAKACHRRRLREVPCAHRDCVSCYDGANLLQPFRISDAKQSDLCRGLGSARPRRSPWRTRRRLDAHGHPGTPLGAGSGSVWTGRHLVRGT